jgi:hypothetical protein
MLNTTQKDLDLFWGRVYGQGDLYVDGPVSGLSISTPNMKALTEVHLHSTQVLLPMLKNLKC